jgi:hypothetical protein
MTKEDLKQKIETIIDAVYEEDGETINEAEAKKHICAFYKGSPECIGCKKPLETLTGCTEDYIERIKNRPQEQWTPEWDTIEVRERTVLSDVKSIGLNCDRCYLSDNCPLYKLKSTCAVDWSTDIHELKPEKAIEAVIQMQSERVQRARVIEVMDGGVPDQNLSGEIDRLKGLIATKADMESDKFSLKIEANAKVNNGGGILSKIFGAAMGGNNQETLPENKTVALPDTTDAEYIEMPIPETVLAKKEAKKEQAEKKASKKTAVKRNKK